MKYLSSEPFTIAVRAPKKNEDFDIHQHYRRKLAKYPHKFENRGVMCGLCGLGREAKIHG